MLNRRQFSLLLGNSALLAQTPATPPELDWHDARKFTVEGLGFRDVKSPYDRLPGRAEGVVRQAVWDLSRDAAGAAIRFTANTTALHARWTVTNKTLAGPTITAVASSGLDLYVRYEGRWRWLSIGRPTKFPENTDALATAMPSGEREYLLYLPLHNPVASLEIGVPKDSVIHSAPARLPGAKSIVFYGTSITHGFSASRSGMTHVAILGRRLNREVINLGFSGNGRMEPEVTQFVAELDPALFVLDCLPNMTAKDIEARAATCVKTLRTARPKTPILLVEDRNYTDNFLNAAHKERNETNQAAMRTVFAELQKEKVPGLFYLKADNLLGTDGEATIDSSHPTDLGFTRQAQEFAQVIEKILK